MHLVDTHQHRTTPPEIRLQLHDISADPQHKIRSGPLSLRLYGEVPAESLAHATRYLPQSDFEKGDYERVIDFVLTEDVGAILPLAGRDYEVSSRVHHVSGTVEAGEALLVDVAGLRREAVDVYFDVSARALFVRASDRIVVVYERSGSALDKLLLWIVRESQSRILESAGSLAFHAAAFSFEENGFVLLGPSGCGKTTFLLNLLSSSPDRARFMCNDRIHVTPGDGQLWYCPLPVRLSSGMAANWPALRNWVAGGGMPIRRQKFDLEALTQPSIRDRLERANTKLELDPSEVGQITGAGLCSGARLSAFIVPKFSLDARTVTVEPVPAHIFTGLLVSELRTPFDNVWPEPWIEPRSDIPYSQVMSSIRSLSSVPAIQVVFGPDAKIDLRCMNQVIAECQT